MCEGVSPTYRTQSTALTVLMPHEVPPAPVPALHPNFYDFLLTTRCSWLRLWFWLYLRPCLWICSALSPSLLHCVAGYVRGSHLWHMCDVSISCCVIFIFIFFMLILQRVWGKPKKRAEGELCYAVPSPDYVKSRKSQIKCEALFALLFRGDALPMFCYV